MSTKAVPRVFPLTTVHIAFGVGVGADPSVQVRLDAFLKTLPRNMRQEKGYTQGVFSRCVDAGFIVWPNWFVNNKAVYNVRNGLDWITVSQRGQISATKTRAGRSLMSYCKEAGYTECHPWVVHDNDQRLETYAVVAWKAYGTNMYCITTNGYRELDQDGRPVRW